MLVWLLLNGIGFFFYSMAKLWILAPRGEMDSLNGISEIYYWIIMIFPILLFVAVVNIFYLYSIGRRTEIYVKHGRIIVALLAFFWIFVLLCDGLAIKIIKIIVSIFSGGALLK